MRGLGTWGDLNAQPACHTSSLPPILRACALLWVGPVRRLRTLGGATREGLALPEVECRDEDAGGGLFQDAHHRRGDFGSASTALSESAGQRPEVPKQQAADDAHGRNGDIPHGALQPHWRLGFGMEAAHGSDGKRRLPGHRNAIQTRRIQAESARPEGEGVAGFVPSLMVCNDGKHCYMNSVVSAQIWTDFFAQVIFQSGRDFLRALHAQVGRPTHLMHMFKWHRLIKGWRAPQMQHDAGEFLGFLCQRLGPHPLPGEWQARILHEGHSRTADTGSCQQATTLEIPNSPPGLRGGRISLQHLISVRMHQVTIHALVTSPHFLCLQLGRFQHDSGELIKNRTPVDLEGDCFQFRDSNLVALRWDTLSTRSELVSVIMGHFPLKGTTPRCCMTQVPSGFAMTIAERDGGQVIPDWVRTHTYLLFCTRVTGS